MASGITIVGLGPGEARLLTREAWEVFVTASEIWLRTGHHPAVAGLPAELRVHTFDGLYDRLPSFEEVYSTIVDEVLILGERSEGVIYAVPGDPSVGEATVAALRAKATRPVRVVHGVSFLEPCLAALGLDALDGLFVADALEVSTLHHPPFPPDVTVIIGQLYSTLVAADVKLTLMNQYPADHPLTLVHAAASNKACVQSLTLQELDRQETIGPLTSLVVPPLPEPSAFEAFQQTVARLRAPDGCPWDREQTPLSLRPHLQEEAFEALQALDNEDPAALREELGDLLLQIVLQAQIAGEGGEFTMAEVIAGINAKIVRRHPHVFGDLEVREVDQVLRNWETLKAAERSKDGEDKGLLGGVPLGLPALAQAAEIQARVARVGFDWPDIEGVFEKLCEELREVRQAREPGCQAAEMGDLLFAAVNYARWLKIDSEAALRGANGRFRRRFGRIEAAVQAEGRRLEDMAPGEMDALWEAAKADEGDGLSFGLT